MALLTNRRRGTPPRQAGTTNQPAGPRAGRKRGPWRLLAAFVLLGTLLWFLPAIAAHTPLMRWVLAQVASELNGTVTVRSASLGWFSPIVAHDLEVCDLQGRPILQAPELVGDKSLAAILWNWSKLGQVRLEEPKLFVLLRNDGSNVEDLLANYLAGGEEPRRVDVALEIVDGSVSVTDRSSGRTWQIEKLQLSLDTPAGTNGTLKLETSATIPDPQHPGRLAAGLTMQLQETEGGRAAADHSSGAVPAGEHGRFELKIESDDLPLAMLQPLIGRFAPRTRLSGRLRGEIHSQSGGEAPAAQTIVRADVTGEDLTVWTPRLGTDRVQLGRLHAACQVALHEQCVEIKQSSVDCDVAAASLRGTLDLAGRESSPLLTWVWHQSCELTGRIDLAGLARMLPNTLRIRKEAEIISGQVQWTLMGSRDPQGPDPQGMVWRGRVEAGNLKATYHGRQLAWEKPILLTLAARDSRQGPVVENLQCESDFFNLHAAGTPRELVTAASFNLKELADQLGQFVDLGGMGLSGDGWAHFHWTRSEEQQFTADAELQLRNFQLATPHREPWTEEDLRLLLSASGQTDLGTETQVQAASLEIKTLTDRIRARLAQPVRDLRGGGTWPVDLQAQGNLQNWPARIARWWGTQRCISSGAYALSTRATASANGLSVSGSKLTVEQLHLRTASLRVDEPHVELSFSGRWDRRQGRLHMEPVAFSSGSLSIRANPLVLDTPEDGSPKITAAVTYQGNLQRLQQWMADPESLPKWRIAGRLSGTADLSQSAGLTSALLDAKIDNLDLTLPSGKRFQEPQVHLVARGNYGHQTQMLRLEQADLTAGSLGVRATGRVARPLEATSNFPVRREGQQTELQLAGQIRYDLAKLTGLLQPYVGSGVRIVGRGTSPASYRGPLEPAKAQAETGLRWQGADVYGFQVGPGELKASLAGGVVHVEPLDLAVNGGRLLLAPRLRLDPKPVELSLPPGPLIKQVQITPAMCASALKFIAPVLADVSTAQGSFSITLRGCRIPLEEPAKGELAGRFTIHSVQVGPGPLVRELAILLGRASPATLRRESVVPFRMVGGRVYHQGLELIFPDLTIRTHGSVGLDQTLAIMAEMPVPPKWLGNNVLGSALKNQTIRLPIGGTLSKPMIDRRELERVSRQFVRDAARNVLLEELQKQLERLPDRQR